MNESNKQIRAWLVQDNHNQRRCVRLLASTNTDALDRGAAALKTTSIRAIALKDPERPLACGAHVWIETTPRGYNNAVTGF